MSTSAAGAQAYNPGVTSDGVDIVRPTRTPEQQAYLDAIAEQAQNAVEVIEAKIAGMQASLKTAKAEAKRARADAQNLEG